MEWNIYLFILAARTIDSTTLGRWVNDRYNPVITLSLHEVSGTNTAVVVL